MYEVNGTPIRHIGPLYQQEHSNSNLNDGYEHLELVTIYVSTGGSRQLTRRMVQRKRQRRGQRKKQRTGQRRIQLVRGS